MPEADPQRTVQCIKLQKELPALAKAPFPTDLGKFILDNVSKEAWDLWLKESVRYINTYRVDLSSREGTEFMIKQLKIWMGLEEGELAQTAWVPEDGTPDPNAPKG
ncbi:MAG: Fe(2+)-trafficking protein [Myxococcales bacterium]|nr:Fe(2+)-trafficking protein [Myxococcales bacterium]